MNNPITISEIIGATDVILFHRTAKLLLSYTGINFPENSDGSVSVEDLKFIVKDLYTESGEYYGCALMCYYDLEEKAFFKKTKIVQYQERINSLSELNDFLKRYQELKFKI